MRTLVAMVKSSKTAQGIRGRCWWQVSRKWAAQEEERGRDGIPLSGRRLAKILVAAARKNWEVGAGPHKPGTENSLPWIANLRVIPGECDHSTSYLLISDRITAVARLQAFQGPEWNSTELAPNCTVNAGRRGLPSLVQFE